jgi:hypothetical protein
MNEINTKGDDSLLDSFLVVRPEKGKIFDFFLISSFFFIVFVLVDLAFDLTRFSPKDFDWQLALTILFLPIAGLVFYLMSKKIGWVINFFYYISFSLFGLYSFVQNLANKQSISIGSLNWRGSLILLAVLTSASLLFSKQQRKYFKINTLLLAITFLTSVGFVLLMIFTEL